MARAPRVRSLAARRQRGAATLVVTLALFLAMALATLAVNNNLVFAQRAALNLARAAQAHEAAEAAIEWATAQLNNVHAIGTDCLPSADTAATSFRDRYLHLDPTSMRFAASASQPVCVRGPNGWSCGCPASGAASVAAPSGTAPAPAFALRLISDPHAGVVRVVASGCTELAGACLPGSSTPTDVTAQISVSLALFAGLRTPPAAALTARPIDAPGLGTDQFFASVFGVDKATWMRQPAVARIVCSGDCSSAMVAAVTAGHALIAVDGDLRLGMPVALGSTARPIVIVANGQVRIESAVAITGSVYGGSVAFGGGSLRGAAISETTFDGAPDVTLDTAVLATLAHDTGSFVRISGSWRDF